MNKQSGEQASKLYCNLCGTEITKEDQEAYNYCMECDQTANEMGLTL